MQPDSKNGPSHKVDADRAQYFRALHGGDVQFLEVFLAKHPDAVRWNTPDGTPPLVLAVGSNERDLWEADSRSWRQKEVMELLLSYGADIHATDVQGRTALLEECMNGQNEDVITMLLMAGADASAADKMKTTALHVLAARDWGEDLLSVLVRGGAKIDAQDWLGNTPLHIAAGEGGLEFTSGHQDAVRVLLSHGARTDIRNNSLRTPLDTANMNADFIEEEGKRPTADIIAAHIGAQPKTKLPFPKPAEKEEPPGAKKPGPVVPKPPKDRFRPKL